jgi:transposase
VRSFAGMMTRRQGLLALEDWLTAVGTDDQPVLHSFAHGIRRDQQAVTAGLALPYSRGALEGKNCKIKYLKRLMYGRANFDLLRNVTLLNRQTPPNVTAPHKVCQSPKYGPDPYSASADRAAKLRPGVV